MVFSKNACPFNILCAKYLCLKMITLLNVRALVMIGQNDLTYVDKDGKLIELKKARYTSSNHERNTLNVRLPNGQYRTLKWFRLIKFNGILIQI